MRIIVNVAIAICIGIISWVWVASLIAFACNQWFTSRFQFRTKTDERVEELLRNSGRDVN